MVSRKVNVIIAADAWLFRVWLGQGKIIRTTKAAKRRVLFAVFLPWMCHHMVLHHAPALVALK